MKNIRSKHFTSLIIITPDNYLSMSSGVSKALAVKAGKKYIHQAQVQAPVTAGDVVVTGPGDLPEKGLEVKHVLHGTVIDYDTEEQPLEQLVYMTTLNCLKKAKILNKSHFSLMLDDVHDLNIHQIAIVNSWIAFRDNSLFSFKIATAKTGRPGFKTVQGGSIIEGHDYTLVDMEGAYQNKHSDFGTWATRIIAQRLEKAGIEKDPYVFLPIHPQFEKDMVRFNELAKKDAIEKYGVENKKAIIDHVYKYERVLYFRSRSGKSNTPRAAYSGFETLLHLSTGVVRNLLIPCYEMYDRVILEGKQKSITHIPPKVQADVILDRSDEKWIEFIYCIKKE